MVDGLAGTPRRTRTSRAGERPRPRPLLRCAVWAAEGRSSERLQGCPDRLGRAQAADIFRDINYIPDSCCTAKYKSWWHVAGRSSRGWRASP